MLTDDKFLKGETGRVEDSLLAFAPAREWQYVTVTFPAQADTDMDIVHKLRPGNPELVDYRVVQASQMVMVYHDRTATRSPWGTGFIRLRANVSNARVTLLLTTSEEAGRVELPQGSTAALTFPQGIAMTGPLYITGALVMPTYRNLTLAAGGQVLDAVDIRDEPIVRIESIGASTEIVGIDQDSIDALSGSSLGRIYIFKNESTLPLPLIHEDTVIAQAEDRFKLPNNANHSIPVGGSATVWYDSTLSRWTLLATAP